MHNVYGISKNRHEKLYSFYLLFIVLRLALIVANSGLEHTKHPSLALNSC